MKIKKTDNLQTWIYHRSNDGAIKNMKRRIIALMCAMFIIFCVPACGLGPGESGQVLLGDEQFDEYIPLLEGKRVALYSNHTGIVGDKIFESKVDREGSSSFGPIVDRTLIHFGSSASGGKISYGEHILDALIERGINVKAVFCPEHGFRGTEDAGSCIDSAIDAKTGVPMLSMYSGDTHSPATEDMDKFDTLVVDMQDVGLRYYTYYIGMYYLMDACAAAGKKVIILDRPNPNGFYVDGPILQDAYKSGVGQIPIPIVHGMTWGELAQMINGEGFLESGKDACDLTVIPCKNYSHEMKYSLIRNPSPNIKNMRAVYLYASTCFFENTLVSVGRGTEFPFESYGSPNLKGIGGFVFSFVPRSMNGALSPPFLGETCYGVDLRTVPIKDIWDSGINLKYLIDAYHAVMSTSPSSSFWGDSDGAGHYWIDLLSGSDALRTMIEAGKTAEEIKASWREDIESFKKQRAPYLIYD